MDINSTKSGVSIIVPVYNAEMYLTAMIDSVISQSYTDWELFLVDNGSKDRSLEICKQYAENDSRICVIQEKEKGASAARNCGLRLAGREYVMFIDADDFLPDCDALKCFIVALEKENGDIVIADYERLWNERRLNAASHTAFSEKNPDSEDFRFQGFFSVGTLSYVWGKLYRRQFLIENELKFENVSYAEDKLFNIECYLCKPTYVFLKEIGYVYRKNNQSVSFQYRADSRECWLEIAYKLQLFLQKRKKSEERQTYRSLIYYILFFSVFFDSKMEYMEYQHSIRAVVRLMKRYQSDKLVRETYIQLRRTKYTGQLSQRLWKLMIYGFSNAMCIRLYYVLALGIKLLIDFRIDERLSDTGLRE